MKSLVYLLRLIFVLTPAMSVKDWMKKNMPAPPRPAPPGSLPMPPTKSGPAISITVGQPPKASGKQASWIPAGQPITVRGYNIPGGMIYVGSRLDSPGGYGSEACLIDPRLDVTKTRASTYPEDMGYWPQYGNISPNSRARYLWWLSAGRRDPQADLGCVFLFFYGLERRLLVDPQLEEVTAAERSQIVAEIIRLRGIYTRSSSFMGYSAGLLTSEWLIYHKDDPAPDYGARSNGWETRVAVARFARQGAPLPAHLALAWLSSRIDYNFKTPAKRCAPQFERLFAIRYAEKFGDGIVVRPGGRVLTYQYGGASPTVRMVRVVVQGLPDPFELNSPEYKKISKLADECTEEMGAYSRMLAKGKDEAPKLSAAAKLPPVLALDMPEVQYLKGRLENTCRNGPSRIMLKGIYETFGQEPPAAFSKRECEELAAILEAVGFGLAPDVRYHYIKIESDGVGVVFPEGHGERFKQSDEFCMMGTILRLGSLVSQSDKEVTGSEAAVLQGLIDSNKKLTAAEKRSLSAFLMWCLSTTQSAAGLKKAFENVSQDEKAAIGRILIMVSGADGRIDPREVRQLEKIYVSLGLDREQVASDVHAVVASAGPVTVSRGESVPTFSVPSEQEEAVRSFKLDPALIAQIDIETKKIRKDLGEIFARQDEPDEVFDEEAEQAESDDPLATLDPPYRELLKRLLVESEWERSAIEAVCAELGVMTDGAMEILNEWAFETADRPLIEYGEPIYIDIELVRGIIDV